MNFFDLHCDTIGECANKNKSLYSNDLHIDLERGKNIDRWCQVFAIWMPDNLRGTPAKEYFNKVYTCFKKEIKSNNKYISQCVNSQQIKSANDEGKAAAVLAVEGGSVLAGDINRLEYLYDCGVRLITLTWNGENELGCGSRSDNKKGLTDFGKEVVEKMQQYKMLVDVSHLNERGFWDVVEICKSPIIATHSNSDYIFPHPRNLTDDQIKAIIFSNGLIGINFFRDFLGGEGGMDKIYAHISHMLDLGGENTIAMGSDFDGCTINEGIASIEKVGALYEYLLNRKIPEEILEKIFYLNAFELFKKTL